MAIDIQCVAPKLHNTNQPFLSRDCNGEHESSYGKKVKIEIVFNSFVFIYSGCMLVPYLLK